MSSKIAKFTTIVLVLLLGTAALLFYVVTKKSSPDKDQVASGGAEIDLHSEDLLAISAFVGEHWRGNALEIPSSLALASEGVYIAARQGGKRVAEAWGYGDSAAKASADAIAKLRTELGDEASFVDTLEVFIIATSRAVETSKQLFSNIRRGVEGLEIRDGDKKTRLSPTYVIASNRKNERLIELYVDEEGLTTEEAARLQFRLLRGPQLLIPIDLGSLTPAPAILMERGNTFETLAGVTQQSVQQFAERMATWMNNNVHSDGRMTYLFWPSRNEEAEGRDNLIRQFMATVALGRIAVRLPPQQATEAWQRSASNINFNLERYYREEGEFGFVRGRGSAKLGSAALAALAIVEHKDRNLWRREEEALRRTVQSLWQEDGSFRTFYKPAARNDNQNFYPGEALLLWATLYSQSKDQRLLMQFMKSVEYYKAWHTDSSVPNRRNPAFVPWHTQAYYMVWTHTKSDALRDFIFEMNDWLLPVQQWKGTRYRDTKGRFHAKDRPFGPPHASSTGVYLEGLVDAYQLAKAVGDETRARAYARAVRRGLRSSMQLQFTDDVDMFYIRDRAPVFGGLRTTVYDNQIRCDNVQHTLMGTQKILESGLLPAGR